MWRMGNEFLIEKRTHLKLKIFGEFEKKSTKNNMDRTLSFSRFTFATWLDSLKNYQKQTNRAFVCLSVFDWLSNGREKLGSEFGSGTSIHDYHHRRRCKMTTLIIKRREIPSLLLDSFMNSWILFLFSILIPYTRKIIPWLRKFEILRVC